MLFQSASAIRTDIFYTCIHTHTCRETHVTRDKLETSVTHLPFCQRVVILTLSHYCWYVDKERTAYVQLLKQSCNKKGLQAFERSIYRDWIYSPSLLSFDFHQQCSITSESVLIRQMTASVVCSNLGILSVRSKGRGSSMLSVLQNILQESSGFMLSFWCSCCQSVWSDRFTYCLASWPCSLQA